MTQEDQIKDTNNTVLFIATCIRYDIYSAS